MEKIFESYKSLIATIPDSWQYLLSIIIILIIIFSLLKFIRKNLIWVVLFLLLLPAVFPSLEIIWRGAKILFEKIPK